MRQHSCRHALSWVTTHLEPEAVQAVLDGAAMGASQRAEKENPTIIENMTNNWNKRCESLLGKSWWKCTSLIGQQLRRKTLS